MKKIITISTLFASSAMFAFASTPLFPDSPISEIVAASQKGGADSANKIMQIQAKEGMDVSKDSFLIYQLASCKDANKALLKAAKDGNSYAIKALKMMKLADAEDTLLGVVNSGSAQAKKDAIDALASCGSEKSLNFFIDNMAKADSLIVDYVKVSTELYKALDESKKPAIKSSIEGKIAAADDDKTKAALERLIVEPKAKGAASEDGGEEQTNSRRANRRKG